MGFIKCGGRGERVLVCNQKKKKVKVVNKIELHHQTRRYMFLI